MSTRYPVWRFSPCALRRAFPTRPHRRLLRTLDILLIWLVLPVNLAGGAQSASEQDLKDQLREAQQFQRQGELEEARSLYLELIPKFRKAEMRQSLGDSLNGMSLIGCALGDYSSALEMAEEAARIRRSLGDSVGEARSVNNMGLAYLYLGEYQSALRQYQEALVLDRRNADFEGQVIRLNNLGNVYFFQGLYFDAQGQYESALQLTDTHSSESWSSEARRLTLANLATVYQKLGQYQKALDIYSQLRHEAGQLSPSEEAQILSNQGALYRHLGDPIKATENYQLALEQYRQERLLDGEISTLKNLGIALALDLKNLQKALGTFLRVVEISQNASNRRQEVQGHLYAAETLRLMDRPEEASAEFELALAGARELGITEEEWKALFGLGRIAESREDLETAQSMLRQAVEVIESERSQLRLTSLKSGFLADKRDVYDALLGVLLKNLKGPKESETSPRNSPEKQITAPDFDLLLELLEKSRARAFQDRYASSLEDRERQSNPRLVRQLRELRSKISRLWAQQLRADAENRDQLRADLARLETEFVAKEREYSRNDAAAYDPAWKVRSVQNRISENTLILEIWMGQSEFALLWLKHSGFGLVTRSTPQDFQAELAACAETLSKPDIRSEAACRETGKFLAGGVAELLTPEIENVVIIPDKGLSRIPFELAPLEGSRYLVERYNVFYLPSLALLGAASTGHQSLDPFRLWSTTLVAFGNPALSEQPKGRAYGERWPNLPFVEQEIRRIAAEIPGRARIFLGEAATRSRLLREVSGDPPILHLATHASVDLEDPQRSRILFGGEGEESGPDYLFLGEILSFNLLRTQLVTLSACDTAVGASGAQDGIQDLGRAFLIAGAGSTVATLWSVPDQTTSEFMAAFYRGLSRGLSKAEALAGAKRLFIESNSELARPYYWAGFVLYGQGDAHLVLPISKSPILISAVVLLLLSGTLLLWKGRFAGRGFAAKLKSKFFHFG